MSWVIYILIDPRYPEAVRYVGKTSQVLRQRLAAHLCAKQDTHVRRWIQKLLREGTTPGLREIERGTGTDWQSRERYWISWYRQQGHALCNLTGGGDGGLNPSPETREKMSAAKRGKPLRLKPGSRMQALATRMARIAAGEINTTPTKETVAKRVITTKATWERKLANGWVTPANWSKYRPDNYGRVQSLETRKKIGSANRGRVMSAEARAKMSAAKKGKPPHNKGKAGPKASEATKAKLSEAHKAAWAKRKAQP